MIGIKQTEVKGSVIGGLKCRACSCEKCIDYATANYIHILNFPLATTKGAEVGYQCTACGKSVVGTNLEPHEKQLIPKSTARTAKFIKYNSGIFVGVFVFWFFKLMADY